MTTPTDDLAAVVRDEAERCGVDVRELARVLLGWFGVDASPPAAPGGDESSGSNG